MLVILMCMQVMGLQVVKQSKLVLAGKAGNVLLRTNHENSNLINVCNILFQTTAVWRHIFVTWLQLKKVR